MDLHCKGLTNQKTKIETMHLRILTPPGIAKQ